VDAARQRLSLWGVPEEAIAEVERTGAVQRTVTLRAPFTGYVIEKSVLLGQRVMPGDPLYKVADLSVVWLEGEIFERDLPALRVGGEATATFQALRDVERRARITYIYPTLNPETRTARVRVELANPDLALKPGMYATLRFSGPIAVGLSVPRSAVVVTGQRNLVFQRGADGRFVPREVELGLTADDRVQILRGLAAGDTVVASATFLIDAESNLGSQLGGMGNMPGMDMAPPDSSAR
jgi:Cu(I)/Ag(I) efflux system membrane fusion protein